jgi:hypothetical protein
MKKAILASLAAAALLGLGVPGTTLAATPNIGAHIHVEVANHPTDRHPIPRAPWTFQVKVILHDQPGMVRYLRVDDSSTPRNRIALALGPCSDCDSGVFPFTIDFSGWSVGRHELRWHADLTNGDKRQFTTSRSQVCIQACSPNRSGRATPFNGGGGWYTDNEYAVGFMLSPETSVRPGGRIIWQAAQDGDACAFLNPDFHHGSSGTNLGCWSVQANQNHTVLIPASAQPGDRLVLYASDGANAGLLRLLVGDGTDRATATYEYQSWWTATELVLP